MIAVNLIPRARLLRRQRRVRTRGWLTATGCYALFLAIAFGASRFAGSGDDRELRAELEETRAGVTATEVALAALRRKVGEAAARLTASRAVGDPPDWSVLLAMMADATAGEIVLRECRVESTRHRSTPARKGKPSRNVAATVELSGLAQSQQAVSSFLLRLERVGLFRNVRLHDTRREPFLDESVVAFRVDFGLDPAGRSAP